MIVYDSNGQPYEADLVLGEKYREMEAERDHAQFWASAHKRRWSNRASELAALRAELTKAEARVGELEDACAELVTDANAVTLAANLARQSKRVKELETLLSSEKATRNAVIAKGIATERANAELAGALREAQHLVVAWESADGEPATELLRRIDAALARHAAGEPAKHPDTEIVDWLDSAECYRWMIAWGGEHEEELHKMRPWKIRDAVRYCIAARKQGGAA